MKLKIKKILVSFLLISTLVLGLVGVVNAEEEDPGPARSMGIVFPYSIGIDFDTQDVVD